MDVMIVIMNGERNGEREDDHEEEDCPQHCSWENLGLGPKAMCKCRQPEWKKGTSKAPGGEGQQCQPSS
jgi:hypothetical protein